MFYEAVQEITAMPALTMSAAVIVAESLSVVPTSSPVLVHSAKSKVLPQIVRLVLAFGAHCARRGGVRSGSKSCSKSGKGKSSGCAHQLVLAEDKRELRLVRGVAVAANVDIGLALGGQVALVARIRLVPVVVRPNLRERLHVRSTIYARMSSKDDFKELRTARICAAVRVLHLQHHAARAVDARVRVDVAEGELVMTLEIGLVAAEHEEVRGQVVPTWQGRDRESASA